MVKQGGDACVQRTRARTALLGRFGGSSVFWSLTHEKVQILKRVSFATGTRNKGFPLGQTGFSLGVRHKFVSGVKNHENLRLWTPRTGHKLMSMVGGNLPCSMDSKQRVPFRANWENDHAFRDKVHNFGRGTQSVTYRHPPTFHGFIFHLPYEGRAE